MLLIMSSIIVVTSTSSSYIYNTSILHHLSTAIVLLWLKIENRNAKAGGKAEKWRKSKRTFDLCFTETSRSVVAQRELLPLYIIYLNVDTCKQNLISNVNDIKLSIVASIIEMQTRIQTTTYWSNSTKLINPALILGIDKVFSCLNDSKAQHCRCSSVSRRD